MPQSRRTPSPTTMHADIQTPSWRPFVPSATPPAHEADISSDDTSDEFYQRLHQAPLEEERARWAPLQKTNGPANKTSKTRGRPAPLFPTPAESVAIMRRAVRNVKRPRKPRKDTQIISARRAAMSKFDRTLAAFAEIEGSLERQRSTLQNHTSELHPVADQHPAATLRLPFPPLQLHDAASRRPGSSSALPNGAHPEEEVVAHLAVSSVADGALADLDDLELIMREKSKAFADRVATMAEQAQIPLRTPITCKSLRTDIARVKRQEDEIRRAESLSDEAGGTYSLSECIRKEIDPKLYHVLAKSFRLHPDYRLDGTRRPLKELLQQEKDDDEESHMRSVSPSALPPNGANNGHNVDGYALDVDAVRNTSDDKDPDYIDPGLSMRDSVDDPMDVQPESEPLLIRPSPRTPKQTKANGSTPRGSVPKRGPGRPRKRKSSSSLATSKEKREKKSFRVVEKDAELISSDPSEPSETPTPPFVGARYATPRSIPSPMLFHQVVDCDKEESDSLDIPMAVVELDNDDDSDDGT